MSFASKVVNGFNSVMSFLGNSLKGLFDGFVGLFTKLFGFLGDMFGALIDFLAKPLSYLLEFLEGIFYFISVLFQVVIKVIMIFVALFQFVFACGAGVLRTIRLWLTVDVSGGSKMVSATREGFGVVTDIAQGLGLLTVVPFVATAFLWFFFIIKIIGLFGGEIHIDLTGKRGKE